MQRSGTCGSSASLSTTTANSASLSFSAELHSFFLLPDMAPALTSNTFRLPFAPLVHARQQSNNNKTSSSGGGSKTSSPFFFDLKNIPDPKSLTSPATSLFAVRRRKDSNTVFVAGATGQSGARIVLTLLRQGFSVRAGVPDLPSAQDLARLAADYRAISPEDSRRLNAVESTFADPEAIAKAIGPAAKAVVTVGLGEDGPTGEVTSNDALSVVRAAGLAGVGHVAVVYDSPTGGPGSGLSTYNVFDGITSFFSNLFSRAPSPLTLAELLTKIAETDVAYTVVKTTLTEDYAPESSYALVLGKERSSATAPALNDSKVSRSQIAKLVADVLSNTSVAENKVVEVSTSVTAASKSVAEFLSVIPEDGRRKAYAEAKAEEEASEKAREAEAAANKPEKEAKKLSKKGAQAASLLTKDVQERAEAVGSSLEDLVSRAKGLGRELSWEKLSSQISTAVSPKSTNDKPQAQIATVRGQARAGNLLPRKAVMKQPAPKPNAKLPKQEAKVAKPALMSAFGGIFNQETIYIDDD